MTLDWQTAVATHARRARREDLARVQRQQCASRCERLAQALAQAEAAHRRDCLQREQQAQARWHALMRAPFDSATVQAEEEAAQRDRWTAEASQAALARHHEALSRARAELARLAGVHAQAQRRLHAWQETLDALRRQRSRQAQRRLEDAVDEARGARHAD